MPSLNIESNVPSFLLGTLAPDAFVPDSQDSFSQHHFQGTDKRISLQSFFKETSFTDQPRELPIWSFLCGYYSHLWLDVFYRENSSRIPFRRPAELPNADLRSLLRRETEILNAPYVLRFSGLLIPRVEDVLLPTGLGFVHLERCIHLFHEVQSQSQARAKQPAVFTALSATEYAAFLKDASKLFIDEIGALNDV
jgi:hypothetical protein